MNDERLSQLAHEASLLEAEIHRLLGERSRVAEEAGSIIAAGRRPQPPAAPVRDAGLDQKSLAVYLSYGLRRLIEDENTNILPGVLRAPRIVPGMEPVMVHDRPGMTLAVIHVETHVHRGLVGVTATDAGGRLRNGHSEKDVAQAMCVDLMGEYIVHLVTDADPGEIVWWSEAPGDDLPGDVASLVDWAHRLGAWLHPKIDRLLG